MLIMTRFRRIRKVGYKALTYLVMLLLTLLVLPTTIVERCCSAFSCEDGYNGNGYDVSVDIGLDNKNFIFF